MLPALFFFFRVMVWMVTLFLYSACATKATEILEASVEAGLTLKEAEDIIFSNTRTLQFFNSVDLKQVRLETGTT